MKISLEPTLIPYNKNKDSSFNVAYSSLNFLKSKIHTLSLREGFDSNLLFLAATCIALTKFTNTSDIFINTKFTTDRESKYVSLHFAEKNRNITVYLKNARIPRLLKSRMNRKFGYTVVNTFF